MDNTVDCECSYGYDGLRLKMVTYKCKYHHCSDLTDAPFLRIINYTGHITLKDLEKYPNVVNICVKNNSDVFFSKDILTKIKKNNFTTIYMYDSKITIIEDNTILQSDDDITNYRLSVFVNSF